MTPCVNFRIHFLFCIAWRITHDAKKANITGLDPYTSISIKCHRLTYQFIWKKGITWSNALKYVQHIVIYFVSLYFLRNLTKLYTENMAENSTNRRQFYDLLRVICGDGRQDSKPIDESNEKMPYYFKIIRFLHYKDKCIIWCE